MKIVDVNGFAWESGNMCYKHEIGFQDMRTCYEGFLTNFNEKLSGIRISKSKQEINPSDNPHFYKDIMIKNMKLHKADILKGLQDIYLLSEDINQFDIDKAIAFTNKVSSLSNKYKITRVLGDIYKDTYIFDDIIDVWRIIEALLYKNDFKKIDEKKKFASKLRQLFDLENRLYDNLFSLFDII